MDTSLISHPLLLKTRAPCDFMCVGRAVEKQGLSEFKCLGKSKAKTGSTRTKSAARILCLLGEWVSFRVIQNRSVHFGVPLTYRRWSLEREDSEPLGDNRTCSFLKEIKLNIFHFCF